MMDYTKKPFYLHQDDLEWIEQTLRGMTLEEKINQVFVDMLWNPTPRQAAAHQHRYQLGGYRYNNRTAEKTWAQNRAIQSAGKIPALIAANVESGGDGAVKGGTKIGDAIACAATGDVRSVYYMGLYGGREAAAVGCNWTFAPVADIDKNWRNCVIPTRCFGRDPERVLACCLAYMQGAAEAGLACCVKHFPGDGCDERDQHLCTTVKDCSCEEWDATFGKIYRGLIDAGAPSIMVGHIALPAYSRKLRPGIADADILPATLAPELLQELLRGQLGFNGLIVTDATHMAGPTSRRTRREYLPALLMSGCDMILYYRDHDEDTGYLKQALADGRLAMDRLDEAVRTVLAFKAHLGLHKRQRAGTLTPPREGLSVIGCAQHRSKAEEIRDHSITLVKNTAAFLPLTPEKHRRVLIVPVETTGLKDRLEGKGNHRARLLAQALTEQGFVPTIHRINYLKFISPRGINGKRALAELPVGRFTDLYDAVIILCHVAGFSTTNERSLHWKIPMGLEIPWYAHELPTIAISTAHPFHLLDLPMVPVYINTYDDSLAALRLTVRKLMGASDFTGTSPVDAFCGRWDTGI